MSQESAAMASEDNPDANSAMTYTEMMNEGKQRRKDEKMSTNGDITQRIEELERRVDHLQKIIQRQIRLGKMIQQDLDWSTSTCFD